MQQFCKNTQALRVINLVCGTVAKGNCHGQKHKIDLKENKPLPKCCRTSRKGSTASKRRDGHIDSLPVKGDHQGGTT